MEEEEGRTEQVFFPGPVQNESTEFRYLRILLP